MTNAIDLTARQLLANKPKRQRVTQALVRIENESFEEILARIRGGESMREIATSLRVHPATLCKYLHAPERESETRSAMTDSAESWLDRAWFELEKARNSKDTATVQLAREFAKEAARRAAIRDPRRYSERAAVELSGPDGSPVMVAQQNVLVYIPQNHRDDSSTTNGA